MKTFKRYRVIETMYIRKDSPHVGSQNELGILNEGCLVDIVADVKGQMYRDIDRWLVDRHNQYYWSGALVPADEVIPLSSNNNTVVDEQSTFLPSWRIQLELPSIWTHFTGRGVGVAIIDTGIMEDERLPFLYGAYADAQNNIHTTYEVNDLLADANKRHGTRCASIINDQNPTVGIARACDLFPVKIQGHTNLDCPTLCTRLTHAINWCIEQGRIDIISVSMGLMNCTDRQRSDLIHAVQSANDHGIAVICASGMNTRGLVDESSLTPANIRGVWGISVYPFTRRSVQQVPYINDSLDCCMPFDKIYTFNKNNGTQLDDNSSSFATAAFTGLLALAVEKQPEKNANEICNELLTSVVSETVYHPMQTGSSPITLPLFSIENFKNYIFTNAPLNI